MSYNKLGFTSGQTLKAEHLNHMEDGIANVSWNDLTDKPFYESVSYGDTLSTNREALSDALSGGDAVTDSVGNSVKVSDAIPTLNDLVNGVIIRYIEDDDEWILSYDDILSDNEQAPAGVLVIGEFAVISSDNFTMNDVVFPEKGTYVFIDAGVNNSLSLTISGYNGFETATVKKIDEKYLPAVGVTKFYTVIGDSDNYLHTSVDLSEETRVHSKDIDAAVSRGTIVLYSVYESGSIDCIMYPDCINPGRSGYWIHARNSDNNLVGYKTSDFEAAEE